MESHQPNKNKYSPKDEPEKEAQVIPPGTVQETGLSRFIRTPDEHPEEVKDARLNNLEENPGEPEIRTDNKD